MPTNRPTSLAPRKPLRITCAWCSRTKVGSHWRELGEQTPSTPVSHGICPACYTTQLAKVPQGYARG